MNIQAIMNWLFAITVLLAFTGIPVNVLLNRSKATDQGKRPSLAVYALSIGIAAFVGYGVGVSIGIGVGCSQGGGNLCGLVGYFFYGPLFALGAAILPRLSL